MGTKFAVVLVLVLGFGSNAFGVMNDIEVRPEEDLVATSGTGIKLQNSDVVGYSVKSKPRTGNFSVSFADVSLSFRLPTLAQAQAVQSASLFLDVLRARGDYGLGIAKLYHDATLLYTIYGKPHGWTGFNVTSSVLEDLRAGKSQSKFTLQHIDYPVTTDSPKFFSGMYFGNSQTPASAPYLRVATNVVFEPISASLFLLGGGALSIRGWQKKRQRAAGKSA